MKRSTNNKGFTLAELLVVVGIIAVLVAISIPVFNSQLHKAKEAVDIANIRALYAEIQTEYLTNENDWTFLSKYSVSSDNKTITCPDKSTITMEAGKVYFNKDYEVKGSYNYYIYYACDSNHDEHTMLITDTGGVITPYN